MEFKTDTRESIKLDFVLCYEIEDLCEFWFGVTIDMLNFKYENNEVWITQDALNKFVTELESLNEVLSGKAEFESRDKDFLLSLEAIGSYGYLLLRTKVNYHSPQYYRFHPITNSFDGGLIIEPAKLPNWIDELNDIMTKREPKTDFLGNFNTNLPLPKRFRKDLEE
jgi:hypothetical protein